MVLKSASMTQNTRDYYKILGVSKLSSDDDLKKVYRKLVLKYHPDKNQTPGAEEKFKEVREAYEFLRDKRKRVTYDMQYIQEQNYQNGYCCSWKGFVQDPPVHYDIYVSGRDIAKGCTKKIKITQKFVHPDGSVRDQDKIFTINVKPDLKAGAKVVFPQEGDQGLYNIPGDVIFTIRDES